MSLTNGSLFTGLSKNVTQNKDYTSAKFSCSKFH